MSYYKTPVNYRLQNRMLDRVQDRVRERVQERVRVRVRGQPLARHRIRVRRMDAGVLDRLLIRLTTKAADQVMDPDRDRVREEGDQ